MRTFDEIILDLSIWEQDKIDFYNKFIDFILNNKQLKKVVTIEKRVTSKIPLNIQLYEKFSKHKMGKQIPFREFLYIGQHYKEPGFLDLLFCPTCGNKIRFHLENGYKYNRFCSRKCCNSHPAIRERREKGCLEALGVTNPFLSNEIQKKIKQTNLKLYNSENPFGSKEIQDKIKQTHLERRGVEYPGQDPAVQEKAKATSMEHFGVPYPNQSPIVRAKTEQTNLKKYKVKNVFESEEIKKKIEQTNIERFGCTNPNKNRLVRIKIEETNNERYGFPVASQNPDVQKKIEETNIKRFGTPYPTQTPEVQEKRKNTCMERFNAPSYFESDEYKEKREKYLKEHGVTNVSQIPEIQKKVHATKLANGTFNSSRQEEQFLTLLQNYFPEITRQYRDEERYPFACDFYVPINDLFIELNFYWSHGDEPYNTKKEKHKKIIKQYKRRIKIYQKKNPKKSKLYENVIKTWTIRDPLKFKTAKRNHLNYKAFYNPQEATDWISTLHPASYYNNLQLTTPSPEEMCQSLQEIYINNPDPKYKDNPLTFPTLPIAVYHQDTIFAQEKAIWNNNVSNLDSTTINDDSASTITPFQTKMFRNCCKHLGKGMGAVSNYEILTSGFSHYHKSTPLHEYYLNPQWVQKFIKQFNIISIYDPCGLYLCGVKRTELARAI